MRNFASKFFVLLFLVINLRGSLGYIFRFGDPATSSTYSERPTAFFIFWNVLTYLMLFLVVYKIRYISPKYLAIYSIAIIFICICISQTDSFFVVGAARSMLLYGFFFICLYSSGSWIKISQINRAIEFMAVFGLVFLFYQIYQYNYFGILPAHSHMDKGIRYGSFYDDSLVLGIMLPMFAGYFFTKYQNIFPSLSTSFIIMIVAFLTGSITAIIVTFLFVLWNLRKRYGILLIFVCASLSSTFYFIDKINYLLLSKSGSLEQHLSGWDFLQKINILNITGYSPLGIFVESGYLDFLFNFGVPIVIIVLVLHISTIRACNFILLSSASSREMQNFAGAVRGLSIGVLLTNFNLAPIVYPPVYLVVVIFSAIALNLQRYNETHTLSMVLSKPRII